MINVGGVNCYSPVELEGEAVGGLILIHEVWGLTEHIKSVADRFSKLGYYVLAPDLLAETEIAKLDTTNLQHGLFNPEKRNQVQPLLRELMTPIHMPEFGKQTNDILLGIFDYLYNLPGLKQNIAVTGFCFGGTYSYNLAVLEPRLAKAIPFYGHNDYSVDELKNIKAKILAFYGEKDDSLVSNLDDLKTRMQQAEVDFTSFVYPDCGHAFFNDSNPYAYNESAAKDAFAKVNDFLAS